jgi:putative peptide zinc metalloprotease protein
MAVNFFSPSWYRVAKLKPRLRGHSQIHRHEYRDEVWYVQQDHSSGRMYRFSPSAYEIIGRMDGEHTVQELWEKALERHGDDAPTQGEVVRLLSQLHAADALICDISPDTEDLFRRQEQIRSMSLRRTLLNPLALKIPLWDPEAFLTNTYPLLKPLFSIWGVLLWLAVVGTAGVLGVRHFSELTDSLVDRVLSADNILYIWLTFPFIKALHELGHGYAVKHWRGEVHEVGIMLLVLMPVPYVDASASTAFRNKWQRALVGAGGILAELFIASLALFVWLNVEQGVVRAIAYNVILIASVSTLLFNANPLLRYDGYYILADILEIPNLAQRSIQYLGYLVNRYVFGSREAIQQRPYVSRGERFWLMGYAIAAFVYRVLVYVGIILFISSRFFLVGILLSLWACFSMFILPVAKKIKFIATSPMLKENRFRAVGISTILLVLLAGMLFRVPFPYLTLAQGVIWVPEEAYIRAGASGFISRIGANPGSAVQAGEVAGGVRGPAAAVAGEGTAGAAAGNADEV